MEIEFLGTGTSTGVPQIGCKCAVCCSNDPRDNRLRASALVKIDDVNLLIDCGPDFRTQILRAGSPKIDAVLVTHSHYDHVGGFDDLRPYCAQGPFTVYGRKDVLDDLKARIPYCFKTHPYPGVPSFDLKEVKDEPFYIKGVKVEVLPVLHYKLLINGYKIENMAYITDAKNIEDSTIEKLKGIDTLIINALRIKPHMSHNSLSETLAVIEQVKPRRAYLIHMSHDIGLHEEISKALPKNVEFAYDRQRIYV